MVHFAEINQVLTLLLNFAVIGRVATPTLVARNCLRYLQATLIKGGVEIGLIIYVRHCLKR